MLGQQFIGRQDKLKLIAQIKYVTYLIWLHN